MYIATKTVFKNINADMVNPKAIDIHIELSAIEYAKLKFGLIPLTMEDKWIMYVDNNRLYMHRSWTGYLIYQAELIVQKDGRCLIKTFTVERDPEKYKSIDDERDIKNFKIHIDYLSGRKINNPARNVILGLIVGDLLGVPVEFYTRAELKKNPVVGLQEFGTHHQPQGTWSDDSSLSLCLAEALCFDFDLKKIGENFVKWYYENHWTPHGNVFDVGMTTRSAIERLKKGVRPDLAGDWEEGSNGNGSIMRILPLLFELNKYTDNKKRYALIKDVSSITHAHARSCLACYYLLEFASVILSEYKYPLSEAYTIANHNLVKLVNELGINPDELMKFNRLTNGDIDKFSEKDIHSSGYVIHTLEASIWCLLTTNSFKEAVLKAVNLGGDTDTTASVTGGLAGLYYGEEAIPSEWINSIVKLDDVNNLIDKLCLKYNIANV
jgi:ADP-ribosylglycohydrolase